MCLSFLLIIKLQISLSVNVQYMEWSPSFCSLFIIKFLNRGNIPQHNKGRIWPTQSKRYPQWWKTESISFKFRDKMSPLSPLLSLSFNIVLKVLALAAWEEKDKKESRLEKKKLQLLRVGLTYRKSCTQDAWQFACGEQSLGESE